VAFVALDDETWRAVVERFFQDNGYHVSDGGDAATALAKLRLNSYDAVVVDQGGRGAAVLAEIAAWPGSRRRDVFVALVGARGASLDPRPGFELSVNAYLNGADVTRASELLAGGLAEYAAYYDLWRTAAAARAAQE
jgi:DNA-binding response OmpR family regulator